MSEADYVESYVEDRFAGLMPVAQKIADLLTLSINSFESARFRVSALHGLLKAFDAELTDIDLFLGENQDRAPEMYAEAT